MVVDTPGNDTYLMRLAHSMADTLITPLNDSFLDFDVLGTVDPASFEVTGIGHYARMVRYARRQRRIVDGGLTDWIVVRNRPCVARLAQQEDGRRVAGPAGAAPRLPPDRRVCPSAWCSASSSRCGLTALDDLDEVVLGTRPNCRT